jgi:hypothetical protein
LLAAYRRTSYRVGCIRLRIGQRSPAMDALLRRHRVREAVLVTAWNPGSRRMPQGWNRRMQVRLRQHLSRFRWLCADGRLRRWREAHLLVLAPAAPVRRVARVFRQRAVVIIRQSAPARLALL